MQLLIRSYKVIGDNNDYLVTTVNGIIVIIQHRIHDNEIFKDLFVSGAGSLKIGEPLSDELKEALGNDLIPNLYFDESSYEYNVTIHVETNED